MKSKKSGTEEIRTSLVTGAQADVREKGLELLENKNLNENTVPGVRPGHLL